MLEIFHVPEKIAIRVNFDDMFETVRLLFSTLGMPEEDARQATDVLLYADVRGIESHGVSNMMRRYVNSFKEQEINPRPNPKIVRELGAVATLDSDKGHGLVVGPRAMRMAIDKAAKYGIGAVTAINGRHFGACAYHAALALEHDMVGLAMTTGGVRVAPVDGSKPMVGLNPLGIAAPSKREPPFIFDASMSAVAGNKISLAKRLGVDVMPGWIAEEDGTPIMQKTSIPENFLMLPLGGTREIGSHKGYSLAVMVEILTSILGGTGGGPMRRGGSAHHFVAYNIAAFNDPEQFKQDMDDYLKALRETPTRPNAQGHVVYAGLPEHYDEVERRSKGIPYHPEVIEWFRETCAEFGIPWRLTKD